MIPILFNKLETEFLTNGLGRLSDCISCIVTEERNGIFECEFQYPITGVHYSDIQMGRLVYVTHDDTKEPLVTWRSHANLLYANWLNYIVYQNTPYDLREIK